MNINDLTLVSIVGQPRYLQKTEKALRHSLNIFPTNGKLISCQEPEDISGLQFHKIEPMTYNEYNKFVLHNLSDYIETKFCIIIQDDGFIINPDKWDNVFFDYDYIGAPWPKSWPGCEINNVGNGGFCLRSKRFLELTKLICPYIEGENEDVLCCRKYRHLMEAYGAKYAPEEIAAKFSIEHTIGIPFLSNSQQANNIKTLDSFGFHYINSNAINEI